MCSRNLLEYLSRQKILHIDADKSYWDEVVGYLLAALGLYFQLSRGFSLPFPLNLLLLPVTVAEYFLIWIVGAK
jgi:hypothetical protein